MTGGTQGGIGRPPRREDGGWRMGIRQEAKRGGGAAGGGIDSLLVFGSDGSRDLFNKVTRGLASPPGGGRAQSSCSKTPRLHGEGRYQCPKDLHPTIGAYWAESPGCDSMSQRLHEGWAQCTRAHRHLCGSLPEWASLRRSGSRALSRCRCSDVVAARLGFGSRSRAQRLCALL